MSEFSPFAEELTYVDGSPMHDVGFKAFVNFLHNAIRNCLVKY